MKQLCLLISSFAVVVAVVACGSDNTSPTSMSAKEITFNQASRMNLLSAYAAAKSTIVEGSYPDADLVAGAIEDKAGFASKAGNLQQPSRQLNQNRSVMTVFFSQGGNLELGYAPIGNDFQPMYLHVFSGQKPIVNVYPPGSSKQTSKQF